MRALSEQAAVTDWPLRLLLTAATAAVIAVALLGLRRGWRRRGQRQQWPALPPIPPLTPGPTITGKYMGTVRAGDWLERIVAGGTVARAEVSAADEGLLLDRQGEPPLFLPAAALREVATAPGMVTKVVGRHGILAVGWRWGTEDVVSGIWFANPSDQHAVRGWVERMIAAAATGQQEQVQPTLREGAP